MTRESIFKIFNNSLFRPKELFVFLALLTISVFASQRSEAHQQPTTMVLLDVSPKKVAVELQLPLSELGLAFGNDITQHTETLIERFEPQLKDYLIAHIRPATGNDRLWSVEVSDMRVEKAEQTQSGAYQEITAHLILTPPTDVGTRQFTLNYDVIMHQVVSHKALVWVRSDWETAIADEKPVAAGVKGTDHLLFLLELLSPQCLRPTSNNGEISAVLNTAKVGEKR